MNEAYRTLGDPVERARYLLGLRGVDAFDETDTSLDIGFLERQLERRERAAEALDARDEGALDVLLREVRADARALESTLGELLETQAPPPAARARVRELKFLDKLSGDLHEMLAQVDG